MTFLQQDLTDHTEGVTTTARDVAARTDGVRRSKAPRT
jgi:hypothetical protein